MHTGTPYNEKEILKRIAADDAEAFAVLFNHWRNKLYTYIYRMTESADIAEDMVQEVFMSVWKKRNCLADIECFDAWLFRISKNRFLTVAKRKAMEKRVLSQVAVPWGYADYRGSDEMLLHKQLEQQLQVAIERLPLRQKQVYQLLRIENANQEEAALKLNISPSTVKNHFTEALRKVKRYIHNYYNVWMLFCIKLTLSPALWFYI